MAAFRGKSDRKTKNEAKRRCQRKTENEAKRGCQRKTEKEAKRGCEWKSVNEWRDRKKEYFVEIEEWKEELKR